MHGRPEPLALPAPRRPAQRSFPNSPFNSASRPGHRHHISFIHWDEIVTNLSSVERKHWTLASLPSPACLQITHTQMMFTAEQSRSVGLANASRGCLQRPLQGSQPHTGRQFNSEGEVGSPEKRARPILCYRKQSPAYFVCSQITKREGIFSFH